MKQTQVKEIIVSARVYAEATKFASALVFVVDSAGGVAPYFVEPPEVIGATRPSSAQSSIKSATPDSSATETSETSAFITGKRTSNGKASQKVVRRRSGFSALFVERRQAEKSRRPYYFWQRIVQ